MVPVLEAESQNSGGTALGSPESLVPRLRQRLRPRMERVKITDKRTSTAAEEDCFRMNSGDSAPEKTLALIGAGSMKYVQDLREFCSRKKKVYDAWTFRIRDEAVQTLRKQLAGEGSFHIYYYASKTSGGSGLIEHQTRVRDFQTGKDPRFSPDESLTIARWLENEKKHGPAYRTWFLLDNLIKLEPPVNLTRFRDFCDDSTKKPVQMKNAFAYVADLDVEKILDRQTLLRKSPEDEWIELEMDEKDLEELIATEPDLLGLGPLQLLDRQKTMESGRLDLLFARKDGTLVMVELKKRTLQDGDLVQLKGYMAAKEFEGKAVKGILVCSDTTERQRYALRLDRKHGYDIEVRTYDCEFRLQPDT